MGPPRRRPGKLIDAHWVGYDDRWGGSICRFNGICRFCQSTGLWLTYHIVPSDARQTTPPLLPGTAWSPGPSPQVRLPLFVWPNKTPNACKYGKNTRHYTDRHHSNTHARSQHRGQLRAGRAQRQQQPRSPPEAPGRDRHVRRPHDILHLFGRHGALSDPGMGRDGCSMDRTNASPLHNTQHTTNR